MTGPSGEARQRYADDLFARNSGHCDLRNDRQYTGGNG